MKRFAFLAAFATALLLAALVLNATPAAAQCSAPAGVTYRSQTPSGDFGSWKAKMRAHFLNPKNSYFEGFGYKKVGVQHFGSAEEYLLDINRNRRYMAFVFWKSKGKWHYLYSANSGHTAPLGQSVLSAMKKMSAC